jgi:hypothetical protein
VAWLNIINKMANEYIGYQAVTPLDWGKLTSGLVKTVQGIGAEREAEKLALDKLQSDNSKILQNAELGKSQNFNQLILSGSNDGRDAMMQWNRQLKAGEISPVEYRNRINNLMDSWSTFANTAKTYDQQMQEALKRQNADENGFIPGSGLELELNERMSQLGDLRDKKTQVDLNNGNFVIGQLDQNGLFDPTSIRDTRSLANPGNITDNRVNLSKIVDEGTKGWEEWTIESGATTITDALQNPAIQRARLNLADGILSNPRAMASVLKDNTDGDYDFYANEKELNSKLQDRIAKENELNKQLGKPALSGDALNKFIESEQNKFILISQDNQGVYQPNLTENQIKQAKQTALDAIDARLGRKVEMDEPYRGGGGSKEKEEKVTSGIPGQVYSAWDNVESLGAAESQRIMSQASGGKYSFKWEDGGLNVYKKNSKGELEKINSTPITNPKYLSDYFGYNPDKWVKEGKQGVGGSKTYSSAQEANIKATLKANPGSSRADVIKALGY